MERVAIVVSGIPRGGYNTERGDNFDPIRNMAMLEKNFPGADLWTCTYQEYHDEVRGVGPVDRKIVIAEPHAHYHPYMDVAPVSEKMARMASKKSTRETHYEKTKHQAKQIYAHAQTLMWIPNRYDIIVRARWDTITSSQANFEPYVKYVAETGNAVGFAKLPPFNTFNSAQELPEDHDCRGRFLLDHLIIHLRQNFDPHRVLDMWDDKLLAPAEFGWWQVLSAPYGGQHVCVDGWASADRNISREHIREVEYAL